MKKQTGISFGRRMLSLMMVLLMAIPWVSAPAMAASNWNGLDIKVYWMDENSNRVDSGSAAHVSWMTAYDAFWLSVPGNAPLSALFLSISYPDHSDYTFNPGNDSSLSGVVNAGDLASASVPISVTDGSGNSVGFFNLYISTNPVPPEPAPTPVPKGNVPILYVDDNGQTLYQTSIEVAYGSSEPVQVVASNVPPEYELNDSDSKQASVDAGGNFAPVVFQFRKKAPASARVTIAYTKDGIEFHSEERTVTAPGESISADSGRAPEGYQLEGDATVNVTVDGNGNASPNPVVFNYKEIPPVTAQVTVQYAKDGEVYDSYEETVTAPGAPISADSGRAPEGYQLEGDATVNVTVDGNGNANPNPVIFNYKEIPAATAQVTVQYKKDGTEFFSEQISLTAPGGPVSAREDQMPAGYQLEGDATVNVTVDGNGNASPNPVIFNYKEIPAATAQVTVQYKKDGTEFFSEQISLTAPGGQVSAREDQMPAGYQLEGEAAVNVTVDSNGNASPNPVVFNYKEIPAATAQVTVQYKKDGAEFFSEQISLTAPGGQVSARQDQTPTGYMLEGEAVVNVTVDGNGNASVNPVVFNYKVIPAASAQVTVQYKKDGAEFFSEQKTITAPGGSVEARADQTPSGYKLDGAASVTVTVDGQGNASPNPVVFNYVATVTETPIPVGAPIDRWATTNKKVNFRSTPAAKDGSNLIKSLSAGTHVWMYESQLTATDEVWTRVRVDGQDGYIMTEFLDMMTKAQSDQYQASLQTPMPTRSPEPNVTASPAPTVTATPLPPQYQGYALTTRQVALRVEVSDTDQSILATLPTETLVKVIGQVYQGTTPWSLVETLNKITGYVPDDALRRINNAEAQHYLDQYNKTPTPSVTPQPTPTPFQQKGYAVPIGDNVPMRGSADPNSMLVNMLAKTNVVYISGQEYPGGVAWQIVKFGEQWGYIRADQLRWLSPAEEEEYKNSLKTPTPTPSSVTPPPVSPNSPSSYGYVTNSGVNFRATPGSSGSRIAVLNKYAFALVLSSTQVDGKTWYKVNQAGKEGYVSGDFFHVLTLAELEEFLQSPEYSQGVTGGTGNNNNNNNSGNNGGSSNLPTAPEDWNVGTWTNPNSGLDATYQPFDPYATPEPQPTASPSPTPEPFETLPPPTDPPVETQSDSPSMIWLGLGVTVLAGFGGLYAYALHKSNQRKAAARAAQRRAAMQQNPQSGARPYARATNAPMVPPAAGTQAKQAPPSGAPRPQAPGGAPSPYSQRPGQPPSGTRPVQPGGAQMPRPTQQTGAYARPAQPGTPNSANRPEAQQGAGAQNGMTGQNNATSRQPRAGRHTGADQNVPTDTNQDA